MIEQLVKLLIDFWSFFQFWTILNAEEIGFLRTLGKPGKDLHVGLNWHCPFKIQIPEKVDARASACICDPQSLRTADAIAVILRLKISYQVVDARRYFLNVFEPGNNIQDVASGELGALVRDLPAEAIWSGKLVKLASTRIKRQGTKWGLEVSDVELVDYAPARTYRLVNSNFTSAGQE